MLQRVGNRSADQNQEANKIDTTEQDNGLVLAEVLISDNGTNDGSNWIRSKSASDIPFTSDFDIKRTIAPELEESGQTSGTLVTHTKSTGATTCTI